MPRSSCLRRIVVVATAADRHRGLQRVPIVWDADSGTFFVGTLHDGSIYQGTPDDATVPVFRVGRRPASASPGNDSSWPAAFTAISGYTT